MKRFLEDVSRFRFLIVVVLLIVVLQVLPGPRPLDDAFITFRYARNLAQGWGFVYNPGQPVLGTTTPLYTLWLALCSLVVSRGDYPWLALVTNAVCDVAMILLLRRLIRALGQSPRISTVLAMGYLLNPVRIGVALGGMETSMVVLWLVAASEAYVGRNRLVQAALFSALAVLTRPDAILLPALFAAHQLLVLRRIPWREGLAFLSLVGPWVVFAQMYFGSALPHSIAAKSQAYFLYPTRALTTLMDFLVTRSPYSNERAPLEVIGSGLLLLLWLYVIGGREVIRAQARAAPLVLYPSLYMMGLALGNPHVFVWYYPPLIQVPDTISLIGLSTVLGRARFTFRSAAIGLCWLGWLGLQWVNLGPLVHDWPVNLREREVVYDQVAAALRDTIPPGSTIALPEIGVLGYAFSQAVIIDTVGLVSPQAIPYLLKQPAPNQPHFYAVSNEVISALQPDYVITLEVFVRPTLLLSFNFLNSYELIDTWDADYFGSRGLLIFKRKINV